MSKPVRLLQFLGIVLVGVCGFFPTMRYERHPRLGTLTATYYEVSAGTYIGGTDQVPAPLLRSAVGPIFTSPPKYEALWMQRAWYPFLLVPVWLLALLLVRFRRIVGAALVLLSLGLVFFEAVYLRSDYAPFLPLPIGVVEGAFAWVVIVIILFWRRRADRALGAVEATVAAQALLCFAHFMTLPMTMARPWLPDYPLRDVAEAVFANFPPAFWIACGGLLLIALPVYLRRAQGPGVNAQAA